MWPGFLAFPPGSLRKFAQAGNSFVTGDTSLSLHASFRQLERQR